MFSSYKNTNNIVKNDIDNNINQDIYDIYKQNECLNEYISNTTKEEKVEKEEKKKN